MSTEVGVAVCTSGTFLSSLLFKLKNAPGDAEGFLLGKVCSHQVSNITDSQSMGRKEERKICLHSFVCFNKKRSFYAGYEPDMTKVESVLGDRLQDVIGWFSYRRNSSHRPSLIEKSLHRKLAHSFKHLQSKDFVFAMITDELVNASSVYSTDYSFHTWEGRFRGVSSEMLTLPSSMPYQVLPTRVLPPHLTHYNDVLRDQRLRFVSAEGEVKQCGEVERLCMALLQKLEPLQAELIATSEQVRKATEEVAELREAVMEKEKVCEEPSLEKAVGVVSSSVSTALLVDVDHDIITMSHDQETLPPSVDILTGEVDILIPEKLSAQQNKHQTTDLDQQSQSQELF